MIPKGVRGNKRSQLDILKLEQKVRALMYSESPLYTDEQILAILQIPERTLYRYKAKIWKVDEPKKEQEQKEYIQRKLQEFRKSISY